MGAKFMLDRLKRFFVAILKFLRGYFMMIGILVTVLPLVLAWIASRSGGLGSMSAHYGTVTGPSKATRLDWALDGELLEQSPDLSMRFIEQFFRRQSGFYLPEVRRALKSAAADKNVTSLVLNIYDLQGSQAEFEELRRAFVDFRKSKKPLHAHVAALDDDLLYLLSATDSVTLVPAGEVSLTGPAFQLVYFGEALRKLGVTVEVIRHGKYKSAFEPFTTNKPSPETMEMYRSMESSLSEHLINTIAEGRKVPKDRVAGWFKRGIFTPAEALNAGIVDALGYSDDAIDRVEEAAESEEEMDFSDYLTVAGEETSPEGRSQKSKETKQGLALIEAVGEIHMTASGGGSSQDFIAADDLVKEIRWAASEDKAKAVVIRISSPGGSATASDIIWREIRALADQKPVVVSMGSYAASGGYYMAAPASWIVAEPTTITGSIGVIGMQLKLPQFESKYGISFHTVNSSDRARLLNPGSASSPEDKAILAAAVDDVYQTFIAKVAEGREMKVDDVDKIAQGRVYTGVQAEQLDLVDELGGLPDAFRTAKELAGLDTEKLYPVLRYEPDHPSLSDCLNSPWDMMECLQYGGTGSLSPATKTMTGVEKLRNLVGEDRILAIWPGWVSRYFL
jgi:protease-4